MSKGMYIGVDGKARKVKNIYIGVDGVARKVKKGYIGVNGVARLFYQSSGELRKHTGSVSGLETGRLNIMAAAVNNVALFAGGSDGNYGVYYNTVDYYDSSLTHGTAADLGLIKDSFAVATVGDLVLFAGGSSSALNGAATDEIDVYGTSPLVKLVSRSLSMPLCDSAGASVGNYAIIAGGAQFDGRFLDPQNIVHAYDASLTVTYPEVLTNGISGSDPGQFTGKNGFNGTTVGDYAIFGRSMNTGNMYIDTYNSSLTHGTAPEFNYYRDVYDSTTVGDYALFVGSSRTTCVDVYNSSLTLSSITLTYNHYGCSATTIDDYALIAGGTGSGSEYTNAVEYVTSSLTVGLTTNMDYAPYYHNGYTFSKSAASVGNYAIFAGGKTSSDTDGVTTVQVYEVV